MRALFSLAVLLISLSPAQAACFSVPDDASSHFVINNLANTLCLQGEIGKDAARAAEDARARLERQLAQQLLQLRLELERQAEALRLQLEQ